MHHAYAPPPPGYRTSATHGPSIPLIPRSCDAYSSVNRSSSYISFGKPAFPPFGLATPPQYQATGIASKPHPAGERCMLKKRVRWSLRAISSARVCITPPPPLVRFGALCFWWISHLSGIISSKQQLTLTQHTTKTEWHTATAKHVCLFGLNCDHASNQN